MLTSSIISQPRDRSLGEDGRYLAIYKAQRFSDHAPLSIDCDWNL